VIGVASEASPGRFQRVRGRRKCLFSIDLWQMRPVVVTQHVFPEKAQCSAKKSSVLCASKASPRGPGSELAAKGQQGRLQDLSIIWHFMLSRVTNCRGSAPTRDFPFRAPASRFPNIYFPKIFHAIFDAAAPGVKKAPPRLSSHCSHQDILLHGDREQTARLFAACFETPQPKVNSRNKSDFCN